MAGTKIKRHLYGWLSWPGRKNREREKQVRSGQDSKASFMPGWDIRIGLLRDEGHRPFWSKYCKTKVMSMLRENLSYFSWFLFHCGQILNTEILLASLLPTPKLPSWKRDTFSLIDNLGNIHAWLSMIQPPSSSSPETVPQNTHILVCCALSFVDIVPRGEACVQMCFDRMSKSA